MQEQIFQLYAKKHRSKQYRESFMNKPLKILKWKAPLKKTGMKSQVTMKMKMKIWIISISNSRTFNWLQKECNQVLKEKVFQLFQIPLGKMQELYSMLEENYSFQSLNLSLTLKNSKESVSVLQLEFYFMGHQVAVKLLSLKLFLTNLKLTLSRSRVLSFSINMSVSQKRQLDSFSREPEPPLHV